SSAETEFVRRMGQALSYATAVVAAEPERLWPEGSLMDRISDSYRRYRPGRHGEFAERAQRSLAEPEDRRAENFGEYGEPPRSGSPVTPQLDDEMTDLLKRAVTSRLDTHRDDILESIRNVLPVAKRGAHLETTKTWLETGNFHGDVQFSTTSLTLSQ